ncbi:MAG: MaoC family dehydratase, partial [Rickettsiales bacterium]|nr:MaoC family dehydratase [Rickettsiales bacterium]
MLYFEDFSPGQQFENGGYAISLESAVAFAREYDPQYFHVDEEAARDSFFGRLVVSGWQTAAVSMRLKALSGLGQIAGGLIGLGLEKVKWPRPVYPGDTLRVVITVLSVRESASKPGKGLVGYRMDTFNQHDALVMTAETTVMVA